LIDAFPVDQQPQIRLTLSEILIGICSQQLLRLADNSGRVAALEILVRNHAIGNLIRESKAHQINNSIMTGKQEGMQLMEQHLKELVSAKLVAAEEAARFSENPQALLALENNLSAVAGNQRL